MHLLSSFFKHIYRIAIIKLAKILQTTNVERSNSMRVTKMVHLFSKSNKYCVKKYF